MPEGLSSELCGLSPDPSALLIQELKRAKKEAEQAVLDMKPGSLAGVCSRFGLAV